MTAIQVEGLSHAFGKRPVLQDVSFTVPEGCFAVLTGPNGSGKSTLIALLANLYGVRQGRVRLLGHDIPRDAPAALARTGIVFQRPALDLDLTVAENLGYHAALHGFAPGKAQVLAAAEMERQGLADRLHHLVRTLSMGQRRRVEIGRALMLEPDILLLDEPATALDRDGRAMLLDRIATMTRRRKAAVFWASHHEEEITRADLELKMNGGKLA